MVKIKEEVDKSYSSTVSLRQDNSQLYFDFEEDLNERDIFLISDYHTTYLLPNGKIIVKVTKNRPKTSDSDCHTYDSNKYYIHEGYVNSYGHKVLQTYRQYKFYFYD